MNITPYFSSVRVSGCVVASVCVCRRQLGQTPLSAQCGVEERHSAVLSPHVNTKCSSAVSPWEATI